MSVKGRAVPEKGTGKNVQEAACSGQKFGNQSKNLVVVFGIGLHATIGIVHISN